MQCLIILIVVHAKCLALIVMLSVIIHIVIMLSCAAPKMNNISAAALNFVILNVR